MEQSLELSGRENFLNNNEENEPSSDIDYIEETIGAASLWQVAVASVASLTRYVALLNLTAIVFLTPKTDFVCSEFSDIDIAPQNGTCYDSCRNYVYNSDVMKTSLISDFQLICDRRWLGSLTQTILMFGLVIGATIFGWISDRFGRRVSIILSSVLHIISMIPSSFAPSYWIFNILRFITGIATGGSLMICLVVVMEVIGKKYREVAMAVCILPDTVAQASLALYAYYLPNWNTFILAYSIVAAIISLGVCFIPESPRWLISRGKVDQAIRLLTRAATFNNRSSYHIREKVLLSVEAMNMKRYPRKSASYVDFFRTKSLTIKTLANAFIWAVLGTNYFGIYQYMTLLDLDIYTTVVLMGFIQIPICPVIIVMTKIFDRRQCITSGLLVTSITMIILIFIPKDPWTTTVFGVIGFACCTISFMVSYLFVAELFPTSLRNMAYGISSGAAKIGSMVAPFIANITPVWIPSSIFAVLALFAAAATYILPETKGSNLKDVAD